MTAIAPSSAMDCRIAALPVRHHGRGCRVPVQECAKSLVVMGLRPCHIDPKWSPQMVCSGVNLTAAPAAERCAFTMELSTKIKASSHSVARASNIARQIPPSPTGRNGYRQLCEGHSVPVNPATVRPCEGCKMPLRTCRSSLRIGPRPFAGNNGSTTAHFLSLRSNLAIVATSFEAMKQRYTRSKEDPNWVRP